MKNKSKIERYIIEEVEFAYENRPLPDNRFFIKVIRHANISIEVTIENFEFCAIVMRNDSDINQWFVTEANQQWVNIGLYILSGSLKLCLVDDKYMYQGGVPTHKATIEELIKHFTK
jgi:hypothetical protein